MTLWLFSEEQDDTLSFSGYDWIVKESRRPVGPGPNRFSGDSITLDTDGMGLAVLPGRRSWTSSEVFSREYFSYGTFTVDFSLPVPLDSQCVFGFFLYNDEAPPYYNEIDFEISRWGIPGTYPCSFSVQPYGKEGNSLVFDSPARGDYRCRIVWDAEEIDFTLTDGEGHTVRRWTYGGDDIPRDTKSRVHLNLWLFQGETPMEDGGLDLIIHRFSYEK